MKIFDVAIIGSGPAGASAAFELAKRGLSAVIIEKELLPRYKTCGGGFVYRGLKNMPFDISPVIERQFYSMDIFFDDLKLKTTTTRTRPIITMIMRDAFDHLIVEKSVESGVTLLQGHKVTDITFGTVQTIHTSVEAVQAKFIIAADGALSPVAKMAGWKETRTLIPALEYEVEVSDADFERLSKTVRFDVDAIPYGYGWCFPKKNHLSLGVCIMSKKHTKADLKAYYKNYLQTLGIANVIKQSEAGFVIPVSPRTDGFVKNNVFLIGDAAGFADPITAEGISNSILSGVLAAEAIAESGLQPEDAAVRYNAKLEDSILKEIAPALKLAKIFYEKKRLRNLILPKYVEKFSEVFTDLFMGDRTYPENYQKAIRNKLKELVFG